LIKKTSDFDNSTKGFSFKQTTKHQNEFNNLILNQTTSVLKDFINTNSKNMLNKYNEIIKNEIQKLIKKPINNQHISNSNNAGGQEENNTKVKKLKKNLKNKVINKKSSSNKKAKAVEIIETTFTNEDSFDNVNPKLDLSDQVEENKKEKLGEIDLSEKIW